MPRYEDTDVHVSEATEAGSKLKLTVKLREAVLRAKTYNLRSKPAQGEQTWRRLGTWLKELGIPLAVEDQGYKELYRWWKTNGKFFNFSKLPVELQMQICSETLGGAHIYPLPSRQNGLKFDRGYRDAGTYYAHTILGLGHNTRRLQNHSSRFLHSSVNQKISRLGLEPEVPPPDLNILRVSKHLKAVALIAGWYETWKHFNDWTIFLNVFNSQNSLSLSSLERGR